MSKKGKTFPDFNMSSCYQIQAKVIAVIEMVSSIIFLILIGFALAVVSANKREIEDNLDKINHEEYPQLKELLDSSPMEQMSKFIVPIFYLIGEFGLALCLFFFVEKNQYKRLSKWWWISITLAVVGVVGFLAETMKSPGLEISNYVFFAINLLFTIYSLWVVYALIAEIKANGVHQPIPYNAYGYKL